MAALIEPDESQHCPTLMNCNLCNGIGWVCVDHPDTPWDEGCSKCEAEGMKCVCNPNALMPEGFKTIAAVEGVAAKGWVQ